MISGISRIEKPLTIVFEIHEELLHVAHKCFEHLNNLDFKKFQIIEGDIFNGLPENYLNFSELLKSINKIIPSPKKDFFGTGIAKY